MLAWIKRLYILCVREDNVLDLAWGSDVKQTYIYIYITVGMKFHSVSYIVNICYSIINLEIPVDGIIVA